nr:retinol dehydrogenase 13-like [Onthophagus taurus]
MTAFRYLSLITNSSCKCTTFLGNKTAIVTGGASGIGLQTVKILASRGAKVIIADKNYINAKLVLQSSSFAANITYKHLDLSSLLSIRQFCHCINKEEDHIDILVNNAGVGGLLHRYTKDLLQEEMQINHFGPFLLTHLLTDVLKRSNPSRIIFVTSTLAYANNLTLSNLNTISDYPIMDFMVYSNSKLCNIIASKGFAEKLKHSGVTSNAVHPGIAVTNIYQGMRGVERYQNLKKFVYFSLDKIAKTPLQAAQTVAHVALSETLRCITGKFFIENEIFAPPKKAMDLKFCNEIWNASEEYVDLQHNEKV